MRTVTGIIAVVICLAGTAARADGKASRLPDLPDPPTDPVLRKAQEERKAAGGAIINLQLTTGHAPKISQATGQLAQALRNDAVTPRLLRELAILRTAHVVGSEYELVQHRILARACGYPQEKIDAVPQWRDSALFDAKERALLAYTDQMTHGGEVDDATFNAFAGFFSPQEIVELSVTIGNYFGTGLLTKALRIKLETDGRVTYQGKC